MGPEKNPALFDSVVKNRLEIIKDDYIRRGVLAGLLKNLSELFNDKEHTSHPLTEPNLLPRLYAISMVQRSPMGIAGFEPMLAMKMNESTPNGSVDAKAAPFHDEFEQENSIFRTRLINITFPFDDYGDVIEFFGINLYQPSLGELSSDGSSSSILVVDSQAHVRRAIEPITGETLVFAVRNKETNDAKIYTVEIRPPDDDYIFGAGKGANYQSDTKAMVVLPDRRIGLVESLRDELFGQALEELEAGGEKLEMLNNPDDKLSSEERAAVMDSLSITGADSD